MSDLEDYKAIVRQFALGYYRRLKKYTDKYVGVSLLNIGGLSNTNYIATIKDMTNNQRIAQVIFRKFGAISDCVDHVLEANIINYLSDNDFGPKSLQEGYPANYRISELIENAENIEKEKTFDQSILDSIYQILNFYNMFSYTFKYNVKNDKIFFTVVEDGITSPRNKVTKTQYENCMYDMLKKAKDAFAPFAQEFRSKLKLEGNELEYEYLDKFENYLNNFSENFNAYYPQNGFLVMSHNDVHRLNFIHKKGETKLYCLDHEYANLNIPGTDIANYMNESNFNYEPEYYFTLDKVNFDKYYEYYQNYIDMFIQNHRFLDKVEGGKEFLKLIKTKDYYIRLHQILNSFWLLYCAIYLDFNEWQKDRVGSFYYLHGIHRLQLLETGVKALSNL